MGVDCLCGHVVGATSPETLGLASFVQVLQAVLLLLPWHLLRLTLMISGVAINLLAPGI